MTEVPSGVKGNKTGWDSQSHACRMSLTPHVPASPLGHWGHKEITHIDSAQMRSGHLFLEQLYILGNI